MYVESEIVPSDRARDRAVEVLNELVTWGDAAARN